MAFSDMRKDDDGDGFRIFCSLRTFAVYNIVVSFCRLYITAFAKYIAWCKTMRLRRQVLVLQPSSRSRNEIYTCRTWHLLPRHPDAVAAVRVCRPSPRTGTDESVLNCC